MYELTTNTGALADGAQTNEIVTISNRVVEIERRMAEYKALEAEQKSVKQALFDAMAKHGVKSWETPGGIKITRVDGTDATTQTVTEFDVLAFKEENPALYGMYERDVEKRIPGRSGYVRVTLPKEETACTN